MKVFLWMSLAFLVIAVQGNNRRRKVKAHNNLDGGNIFSPNFFSEDNFYPDHTSLKHIISAPSEHVIILEFRLINLFRSPNDSLTIRERLSNGNLRITSLYGYHIRVAYVSSSNQLIICLESGRRSQLQTTNPRLRRSKLDGFSVHYSFINTLNHCLTPELRALYPNATITCRDERFGRATGCSIFRQDFMNITRTCVNGSMTTTSSNLNIRKVIQCENREQECPFNITDIVDYYTKGRLPSDFADQIAELGEIIEAREEKPQRRQFSGRLCPYWFCAGNATFTYFVPSCAFFLHYGYTPAQADLCANCRIHNWCALSSSPFIG